MYREYQLEFKDKPRRRVSESEPLTDSSEKKWCFTYRPQGPTKKSNVSFACLGSYHVDTVWVPELIDNDGTITFVRPATPKIKETPGSKLAEPGTCGHSACTR